MKNLMLSDKQAEELFEIGARTGEQESTVLDRLLAVGLENPNRQRMVGKRVQVLDHGWIELIDLMGNDRSICQAARTSRLGDQKNADQERRLIAYLVKHKHTSPFEMVAFKFRVHAPIVVWWQWVRHRTWSYNASSGRYTSYDGTHFYVPKIWRRQSKTSKQASGGRVKAPASWGLSLMRWGIYKIGLLGYRRALAWGVGREQARLLLPGFACYHTFVCKVDALNLSKFIIQRLSNEAQWEIREYAHVLWHDFFEPILPWTAAAMAEHWGVGKGLETVTGSSKKIP